MKLHPLALAIAVLSITQALGSNVGAQSVQDPPAGPPEAVIDLATDQGARLVNGEWRYHNASIVTVDYHAPGPDLRPSGLPIKTYDVVPHAGEKAFNDSSWERIAPGSLAA